MKRFLVSFANCKKGLLFLFMIVVSSCDNLGSTKIKNLVDFTKKLEVEEPKNRFFSTGKEDPLKDYQGSSYNVSKRSIIAQPAIAKKVMYNVDKEGYVSAFSLEEKKLLWTKNIVGPGLNRVFSSGGILFSDGLLYVTYGTRNLVILDAANGNEVIRKEFPDILRTKPVMVNDRLLLAQTVSNQLVAYDTKASKLVWMHEGGLEIISSKNHVSPTINNGNVLVSYSSGEVVYLNATKGEELWRYSLTNTIDIGTPSFDPAVIVTAPIIDGNFVYFATSNGKIVKLDLKDGKELWVKNAQDIQSMAMHDQNLIVTNNARQVAILSTSNGRVNWIGNLSSVKERGAKKLKPAFFLKPFVVKNGDNYIVNVISLNGQLYQFKTDDSKKPSEGKLSNDPVISNIGKDIKYYWISCCNGAMHLISSKRVSF